MSPSSPVQAGGNRLRRQRITTAALALMAFAACAAPAWADHSSGELGVPGLTERQLRAFERTTLGPGHAAEHARLRRAERDGELTPAAPAGRASVQAAAALAGPPEQVGRWSPPFPIPVMGIHAAMLPTGKVMWFSYPKNPAPLHGGQGVNDPNTAQAWLWDPSTGITKRVDPPLWRDPGDGQLKPANIWCAGQTFTADGRLVVFGGNMRFSEGSVDYKGLNKIYTFNPFNETWTEQPDMRHGRWYPTGVRTADGRIAIINGLDESGAGFKRNADVELFTPSADLNGRGTVGLLGTLPQTGAGEDVRVGGLYPHMFAMPSGRAMVAGPFPEDTWFLDPAGPSSSFTENYPNMPTDRLWGTAVLMPGGTGGSTQVMQLGGSTTTSTPSVATTQIFDEANPAAGWQARASMQVPRGHHNTVLLPDGSMVTVGGGVGVRAGDQWAGDPEQRQVELWNPATGNWTLGPSQAETRAYHSTALLLPDGRVVSAGDDVNGGTDRDTAEIYEPPYLFRGARPTISSAPPMERVGDSFDVYTPDTNITGATLVAPGATTHANDMNQRYIPLTVAQRAGGVTLTAPANADIATPGYYMLFLLNNQGVPSVAKFMRLGYAWEPAPPPTPPPTSPSAGGGPPDRTGPKLHFRAKTGFNRRRWRLSGSASDSSGVRRVELALARKQGRRCRYWSPRRGALGKLRSCTRRRVFFRANLAQSGSPRRWSAKLRGPLPPGRYLLALKGTDREGNVSMRRGIHLRVEQRRR